MLVIPEMVEESSLTIASPRLTPDVRATDDFCVSFADPFESQFTMTNGFSNINHIRRHVCIVIGLDKKFDFFPGPHQLDIVSPLALAPEAIGKIACRYFCFPLERADNFYQKLIEQEIA